MVVVVAVRARARARRRVGALGARLLVVAARARHGRLALERVRARAGPLRVQRLGARVGGPLAAPHGRVRERHALPAVRRRPHRLAPHANIPSGPSERVQHSLLDLLYVLLLHEPDLLRPSCEITRALADRVFLLVFKFTRLKIILSIYIVVEFVYVPGAGGVRGRDVTERGAVGRELVRDFDSQARRPNRHVHR